MYLYNFHPGYTLDFYSDMYPEQLNFHCFLILQRCNLKTDDETIYQIRNLKYKQVTQYNSVPLQYGEARKMYLSKNHQRYTLRWFSHMYPEQKSFCNFLILQRCSLNIMDKKCDARIRNSKYIILIYSVKKLIGYNAP